MAAREAQARELELQRSGKLAHKWMLRPMKAPLGKGSPVLAELDNEVRPLCYCRHWIGELIEVSLRRSFAFELTGLARFGLLSSTPAHTPVRMLSILQTRSMRRIRRQSGRGCLLVLASRAVVWP